MRFSHMFILAIFIQAIFSIVAVSANTYEPPNFNRAMHFPETPIRILGYSAELSGLVENIGVEEYAPLVQEENAVLKVTIQMEGNWTSLAYYKEPYIFLWSALTCTKNNGSEEFITSNDWGAHLDLVPHLLGNITEWSANSTFRVEPDDKYCRFDGYLYAHINDTVSGWLYTNTGSLNVADFRYTITKSEYLQRLDLKQQRETARMQYYILLGTLVVSMIIGSRSLKYQKKQYELDLERMEFDKNKQKKYASKKN